MDHQNEFTINEDSKRIDQPKNIKIQLKPHQLAMIYAMNNLEESKKIKIQSYNEDIDEWFETSVGCLCDKVGSGKSLITLGLISNKPKRESNTKVSRQYGLITTYKYFKNYIPINLLVVPHNIIKQWEKYITDFTDLKYLIINNKKTFVKFIDLFNQCLNENMNLDIFNHDLILVSNTFYNKVADIINNNYDYSANNYDTHKEIMISRLIVDEVDTIKVSSSSRIHADFTWFISSSIKSIQNPNGYGVYEPHTYTNWQGLIVNYDRRITKGRMAHTGYFKDVLNEISSIYFKNMIYLKNEDKFIELSFKLPEINKIKIHCKGNIYTNVLYGIVNPQIMNMINAGDIESAIEQSGLEQENEEGLIKIVTRDLEKNLNNKKIELQAKQQMTYSNIQLKEQAIKKIKDDIKKLEEQIEQIKKRLLDTESCPICYDTIKNRVIVKCCNNPYCYECIMMSINHKPNCPLCRKKICKDDIIVLDNKDKEENVNLEIKDEDCKRSKIDNLKKYLDEVYKLGNRKILIFSEYDNSFKDITNYLEEKNYKYSNLKGSTGRITNIIEKYKGDELDILLLNSRYFGSGLNLENTTDIFMFHKMNESIENQVIGRAQRPGRTNVLNVYRLLYQNEL